MPGVRLQALVVPKPPPSLGLKVKMTKMSAFLPLQQRWPKNLRAEVLHRALAPRLNDRKYSTTLAPLGCARLVSCLVETSMNSAVGTNAGSCVVSLSGAIPKQLLAKFVGVESCLLSSLHFNAF